MKKAGIRLIAAIAIIMGTSTTSVFANGFCFNQSGYGHRNGYNNMQNRGMHYNRSMMQTDILGTITAISTDSKIITVKDIDGKESSVHINPITKLLKISKQDTGVRNNNRQIDFTDIKTGDWVIIRNLYSETKIFEAAEIIVSKE